MLKRPHCQFLSWFIIILPRPIHSMHV
jgi:hypothetical protein